MEERNKLRVFEFIWTIISVLFTIYSIIMFVVLAFTTMLPLSADTTTPLVGVSVAVGFLNIAKYTYLGMAVYFIISMLILAIAKTSKGAYWFFFLYSFVPYCFLIPFVIKLMRNGYTPNIIIDCVVYGLLLIYLIVWFIKFLNYKDFIVPEETPEEITEEVTEEAPDVVPVPPVITEELNPEHDDGSFEKPLGTTDESVEALNAEVEKATNTVTDEIHDSMEEKKEEVQNSVENVKDSMEEVKENVKNSVEDSVESVKEEVQTSIADSVEDVKEGVQESVKETIEETKEEIKDSVDDKVEEVQDTKEKFEEAIKKEKEKV